MKQWEEEAIGGTQEEGEHILVNSRDEDNRDSTDKVMAKDSLGLQSLKKKTIMQLSVHLHGDIC